jgi:hypothetical protein
MTASKKISIQLEYVPLPAHFKLIHRPLKSLYGSPKAMILSPQSGCI